MRDPVERVRLAFSGALAGAALVGAISGLFGIYDHYDYEIVGAVVGFAMTAIFGMLLARKS